MHPKLILLNGPLGIGKSTLATKYADEHPLTLRLDIDDVRTYISQWRDQAEKSARSSKLMAFAMAEVHLNLGYDVIVPQIIQQAEMFEGFETVALKTGAYLVEILLYAEKDESIRRFKERNIAQGYADGFRPGGLIDRGGREAKLASMYDEMMETVSQRPHTIKIEPILGDIDATYNEILTNINATN